MLSRNPRKSQLEIGKIYFWTATIRNWLPLLESDTFKLDIIESLKFLSKKGLIDVFGFVLMPNHLHLIWRINKMNGKELPSSSLLKFTAHQFKKKLAIDELTPFQVSASNKQYEFWQRDSTAIELWTPEIAYQKLDYMHRNPVSGKWLLVQDWVDYPYSSGSFYENNHKGDFGFLKHLGNEF